MPEISSNNKRVAKNTLFLYLRTFFIMIISLYTSRVILNILGVENYGIYNAVGGATAMFSVISGALSASISRFITYELGRGNVSKLNITFSTSINIQIIISAIVLILGEVIGYWFLNTQMNIPVERMAAANWVLHCSLISFCIGLISVPYNACIIAHERMKAFAYVSIIEAVLKLAIVYLLLISDYDKLISYSILHVAVAIIIRIIYGIYCSHNFEECHYQFKFDKATFKDMFGFAGWSFLTSTAYTFNTQGINILINIFFGVTLNAARAIATQIEGAIVQFVSSFTTAINPQITKQYAQGNKEEMFKLICYGAKYSYFLTFLMALPILCETEYILKIWLNIVPEHTVPFIRLIIIGCMIDRLGHTTLMGCQATGKMKLYTICISSLGILLFPITWIMFSCGLPAESTYVAFIFIYLILDFARIMIIKKLISFPATMFLSSVVLRIIPTSILSPIIPLSLIYIMPSSFVRLIIVCIISFISVLFFTYFFGLSTIEQRIITDYIKNKRHHSSLNTF